MFKCGAVAEHARLNQLLCVNQLRFLLLSSEFNTRMCVFSHKFMGLTLKGLSHTVDWTFPISIGVLHAILDIRQNLLQHIDWSSLLPDGESMATGQVPLCPISFAQHHHCEDWASSPSLAWVCHLVCGVLQLKPDLDCAFRVDHLGDFVVAEQWAMSITLSGSQ